MDPKPHISVVVPVYNEAGNITALDRELKKTLATLGRSEIIYVNDGSKDGSLEELKTLKDVTILNMNRNYGQATSLEAGFATAQGDLIVSLDGDGQNDPADIPRLIEKLERENLDVVAGWRKSRADKKGIKVLTRIGRMLRRALIADTVHDTGCTLRVYRREAAQSLELQGEMHRYVLALLRWKGFTIGEMVVNDRARQHGVSKYGYSKAIRGFIDLIYIWFVDKYSQRPLHLFGYLSAGSFVLAFFAGVYSVYSKIALGIGLSQNGWFSISLFALLASVVFFSFGIAIDLLIRIHLAVSNNERRYYIREIITNGKSQKEKPVRSPIKL